LSFSNDGNLWDPASNQYEHDRAFSSSFSLFPRAESAEDGVRKSIHELFSKAAAVLQLGDEKTEDAAVIELYDKLQEFEKGTDSLILILVSHTLCKSKFIFGCLIFFACASCLPVCLLTCLFQREYDRKLADAEHSTKRPVANKHA